MMTPTPNFAWRTLWPMRQAGPAAARPPRRRRRRGRAGAAARAPLGDVDVDRAARCAPRRQPLHEVARQLVEEARRDVVAHLAVQHPALRVREVEPAPRARDRDVHEPPLLLDAVELGQAVLVREQPLLEPGDEHRVELEALRRVHGHQLQRRPAFGRLRLAGLERRVREERGQRIGRALVPRPSSGVASAPGARIGASTARSASRRKLSAALTSSSRLSSAVLRRPSRPGSARRGRTPRSRARPPRAAAARRVAARIASISRTNAASAAPALPPTRARSRRPATALVPCAARGVLQLLERARADAARRKVDDAQERAVVVGRRDEAQVGERVLDLGALEEAHAAVDAVRHAGAEQRVLEHARLRVASGRAPRPRTSATPSSARPLTMSTMNAASSRSDGAANARTGSPLPSARPQVLAEPRLVVADQRVGGVEDVAVRAVVLLELDERAPACSGAAEVALEVLHVGDVRAAERVDRLVVVADGEHRRVRRRRAAAATGTAARWCPGTRRPAGARSAAGSARAARSCRRSSS